MMTDEAFRAYREQCGAAITTALEVCLPQAASERLRQAMHYVALGKSKRIRSLLVYAAGQAVAAPAAALHSPGCAVELIHSASLAQDDLPAIDNDDLRRGVPACHKAFDEATTILTGDALILLAFQVLAQDRQIPDPARLQIIGTLAAACGACGMVGGQAMDIAAVAQPIDLPALEQIHRHKTGALIRASVQVGALCASDVSAEATQHLAHYADCIGLAFQVQDDVLDVTGQTQELGKHAGKDAAQHKPTYPALLGLSEAKDLAQKLVQEALDQLTGFDQQADPLRQLAGYIIQRTC